jgi:polysaccharide export outer membrane protein
MRSIMNRSSCAGRVARAAVLATAVLTAAGLIGCTTTPYPPAPQSAATPDYLYKIGPLDSVNVIVWRNPELSTSVPVRPDGKITAPLIEDLPALGKDSTTLARDVEKALSRYIRDPVVTIIVTNFNGPYPEQIRVVGEAAKPQALSYRQGMTLLDLMIAVGGLTDFADGNNASIMRTSEGGRQYNVRLKDLVKRGDISANVDVKPGDILLIPQSWF